METVPFAPRPPKRPYWFKFHWREAGVSYRCERCGYVAEIQFGDKGLTVPEWIAAADAAGQQHVDCR